MLASLPWQRPGAGTRVQGPALFHAPLPAQPRALERTIGQVGGQVCRPHAARRGQHGQHEEDKQRLRQAAHRVDHKQVQVRAQLLPRLPAACGTGGKA